MSFALKYKEISIIKIYIKKEISIENTANFNSSRVRRAAFPSNIQNQFFSETYKIIQTWHSLEIRALLNITFSVCTIHHHRED